MAQSNENLIISRVNVTTLTRRDMDLLTSETLMPEHSFGHVKSLPFQILFLEVRWW
jgi:hypothetical protein